ncbi:phage tail tape measure protein, partial [Candidatus Woesearchaeota archaeon]
MAQRVIDILINVRQGDKADRTLKRLDTTSINLAFNFHLLEQAAQALNRIFDQTISKAIEVEKEIAIMGAIVGETADSFSSFTDRIREQSILMSTQYPVGASEVVRGMTSIAQAGFTEAETIALSNDVLALATATNADFADAAAVTVTAMRAMGLEVSDSERLVNVFQFAVNRSRNTMEDLANSLKFVTGFANTMGIEIEDLVAAQMALVNSGLEAGIAGRSIQQMLMDIVRPSQKAREVMKQLGINFTDASGNMKDMVGIAEELQRVFGTTTLSMEQAEQMST